MRKIVVTSIVAALMVTVGGFAITGSGTASGNSRRPTRTATPTRTPTVPAAATSTPAATWTPAATDTPTATPPPVPTPPTIVGNRAFNYDYGASTAMRLVNTDDGSVLVTFPVGDALASQPFSCNGAYAVITTPAGSWMTFRIISTRDGSTVASDPTLYTAPTGQFTCPLKGVGAHFDVSGPVANRAIVRGADDNLVTHVKVFDLTNGQMLYENDSTTGGAVLSCAQNTVTIPSIPGNTQTVVRLSDRVASTVAGNPPNMTC